uniref:ATP synthase F0 subunit 8 n=1 Tax=Kathetostoma albigutta TaxID=348052 RepID=UPI0028D04236|nr:ATP synthase F0 subunit 8 [Kathetostoma albigutta]WMY90101.1 ATP synthase F0 subunit 8 [Kathetostoma albigutta]
MPQLNPTPWFYTLAFSWLIFLTIVPQKVLALGFLKNPSPHSTEKIGAPNWNWPWQ